MSEIQPHPYKQKPIEVSGIHLYRLGDDVIVCAEINGKWVEVIREHSEGSYSHIVEPNGMRSSAGLESEYIPRAAAIASLVKDGTEN